TIRFVSGMNNLGQLVGQAQRRDGAFLSVMLTPRAPDTTAPVVSVSSPSEGATLQSPVPIKADVTDTSSVLWVVSFPNDFAGPTVTGTTKGPGAINVNSTLPTGEHLVQIDVIDSSGNKTTVTRNI